MQPLRQHLYNLTWKARNKPGNLPELAAITDLASRDASILLEQGTQRGYYAMLHIDGKTSRYVAFKSVGSGYEWIGEQEDFEGPRTYQTVDGEVHESITITYDKVPISGFPINELSVLYHGEDPALVGQLSLEAVRPMLTRWGY